MIAFTVNDAVGRPATEASTVLTGSAGPNRQEGRVTSPLKSEGVCGATILPHRYCPKCKRYGELSLGNDKKSTAAEPKGKK